MEINKNAQGPFRYNSLQGIRMLIIDDDKGLCSSLKFFFEDLDCHVTTSNNAEEGLELYNNTHHDIILVDLNMPGMGGHNFIANLTRNYPNTPVIVISGTGVIKEAVRSINLGAWDFQSKPILNFEDLEISVLKALEKSFLIQENERYKKNLEKMVDEKTSELKHKNIELEQIIVECKKAKEKAEEADKLKTEFLAQISHEIRTPLFQITGYTDIAKNSLERGSISEIVDAFEEINKASARIIRTIELILSMSELNTGLYKPDFEIRNLADLIEDVVAKYLSVIYDKNLNFSFKKEYINPNVLVDKYSIEQIIDNLFDNAVKFTHSGSIILKMYDNDKKIIVEIIDTGIGISDSYMKSIFTPFSQEEHGYDRKYEGNGLGLAITKKFCELNKAELNIESQKGIGTKAKIIFDLPNN